MEHKIEYVENDFNGVKEGITSIAEMIKATYEAEEEEKK